MTISRVVTGLWRTQEETGERPKFPELKTPYYSERKERAIDNVVTTINNLPQWKLIHVDKERGEIMAEKMQLTGKSDLVIQVYSITPVRSAIDVFCSKRGFFGDLGSSYFNILEFFRALHKVMPPNNK